MADLLQERQKKPVGQVIIRRTASLILVQHFLRRGAENGCPPSHERLKMAAILYLHDIRRRQQPTPSSSSSSSDGSDIESCFDTGDEQEETDAETEPTDVDTDLAGEENAHPPEYYLDQENNSDESEDEDEDYSDGSLLLLDIIEGNFHRYCKYVRKDPARVMQAVSRRTLKAFFEWIILGIYWKVFRLVYERATREKIEGKMNRYIHRVLRKLAKKYRLSTKKRDNIAIYIEDLAGALYTHSRQRIQTSLFCQLAIFSANRPSALLKLRYSDIAVNLLRDPSSGPYRILIKFTCEFTKKYLGTKDANTFILPEIIFDPSLILSPHVALLGLIFADNTFLAPSLTSAERISELDIPPGYEQLPLYLKPEMADIPVLRKSMKRLGVLTGFPQITPRPYPQCDILTVDSGDVSDALQNMIMQHAKIDTFIKHYLRRTVTADTRAIVSGYEPQRDLMRAAYRMTRWIDPDRPQDVKTTLDQNDEMPPLQKRLAETVMTLPGTTIEEEFRRRNAAIDVVAAYYYFQEGRATALPRKRSSTRRTSPMPSKEANPQLAAAEAEKQALSDAILLVFTEKRTTTCFLCLGEQSLPFEKRTYKFASPGDLTKHFKRKHLAHIKEGDRPKCKVCRMGLQHKQHLQNHAESIHGTVS
ncbi:hypothetical protein F5882DRAFT_431795 [Hyaloscypha sp. PMI_1271]|nr:hypothetical protein F5882DRAFT_431795 [Hyaloscypha sp. PMI_1271]